jgi:hypothetical protein
VSISGRNDGIGWGGREQATATAKAKCGDSSPFDFAQGQNDDVKLTTRTRVKTKYRDLSTAAAKCAAFGRDDVCYELGLKRTSKSKF